PNGQSYQYIKVPEFRVCWDYGETYVRLYVDDMGYEAHRQPPLTNSLDAARALIERALPGRAYFFGKGRDRAGEPLYGAVIHDGMSSRNRELGAGEHNANIAIAVCLALVSALIAIEEEEERGDA
ncbi:MAG TPA: hypothetical protein VIG36_10865, partial [Methylocystis sp.]